MGDLYNKTLYTVRCTISMQAIMCYSGVFNVIYARVQSRDCAQLGPPPLGEAVQVRWTDGLIYGAKFVAAHVIQMYQVSYNLSLSSVTSTEHKK